MIPIIWCCCTIQTANETLLRRNQRHLKKTAEPTPMSESAMEDDDIGSTVYHYKFIVWMGLER